MKRAYLIGFAVMLFGAGALVHAQTPRGADVRMKAAQHKADVEGDLKGAIDDYKKVVAAAGRNRALAAEALVRMAECYQKLGDAEARKIYEQVLREYADQKDLVTLARARLGAPAATAAGMVNVQKWTGSKVGLEGGVSPDGRYLSFTDWDTGDLALHDLTTGTDRRLTDKGTWDQSDDYAEESAFSPDGTQIAYTWFLDDKRRCQIRVLKLGPTAVATPRILLDNPDIFWVSVYDWSPDGKWLAVEITRKDRTEQLGLVNTADGSVKVLKLPGYLGTTKMFFSPDGASVAYDRRPSDVSEQRDVFILTLSGQDTPAVVHPAMDTVVGWTPDGRSLLFASDRAGSMGLWALPVANGKPQGVPVFLKDMGSPFIRGLGLTRSGNLLYGVRIGGIHIDVASVDFETGKVLAPPRQAAESYALDDTWPDWSRDGKSLLYVSGAGDQNRSTLLIRSMDTGQVRSLRLWMSRVQRPRWAPDGSIVFQGRDANGQQGIYRVDPRTGDTSPVVLSKPGTGSGQFHLSPDGKLMFYRRSPDGASASEPAIIERNLVSGNERELVSGGDLLIGLSLSPDGRQIGFVQRKGETWTLSVMPVDGGPRRELYRVTRPGDLRNSGEWTPDGRHLLFVSYEGGKNNYLIIPSTGGTPVRLELPEISAANSIRIHPDGRQVAFNAGSRTNEVWTLENFVAAAATKTQTAPNK